MAFEYVYRMPNEMPRELRRCNPEVSVGLADVVARCRMLVRMGARHLSFGPPLGPDPVAAIRLLGDQVLPALMEET